MSATRSRRVRRSDEPRFPDSAALAAIDDATASVSPSSAALASWYSQYSARQRIRLAHDFAMVRQASVQGTVLDIGCTPPLLSLALSRAGLDVTGIDVAPDRFKLTGDSRLRIHAANIETEPLPFGSEQFDLVLLNEVFEHLRIDLIGTLREVRRVTRTGGKLFLSTPNVRSIRGVWNFLRRNRCESVSADPYEEYLKLTKLGHMGHVREYTYTEVCEFLKRVGFTPITLLFRGSYTRQPMFSLAARVRRELRPYFSVIATAAELPSSAGPV